MPLLEGPIIPQNGGAAKPPLQFTLYLPLLGGAYFGQIFCFKNPSKNQTNEILVQNYSRCLISISLLYHPGGTSQEKKERMNERREPLRLPPQVIPLGYRLGDIKNASV